LPSARGRKLTSRIRTQGELAEETPFAETARYRQNFRKPFASNKLQNKSKGLDQRLCQANRLVERSDRTTLDYALYLLGQLQILDFEPMLIPPTR